MRLSNKLIVLKYRFIILGLQIEISELLNRRCYSITEMEMNALNERIEFIKKSIEEYEEKIERLKAVVVKEDVEEYVEEEEESEE
jgi:hypothetical protein